MIIKGSHWVVKSNLKRKAIKLMDAQRLNGAFVVDVKDTGSLQVLLAATAFPIPEYNLRCMAYLGIYPLTINKTGSN